MLIAYLYNRPVNVAQDWGADMVFADMPGTGRVERSDMIDRHGLRDGDTLVMAARSDIGQGREVPLLIARIEALGVTVEIRPLAPQKAKSKPGRTPKLSPTPDQKDQLCKLWGSTLAQKHVLARAAQIMGVGKVTRNQMNRLCGPRTQPK